MVKRTQRQLNHSPWYRGKMLLHPSHSGQEHGQCITAMSNESNVFFNEKRFNLWFSRCTTNLLNCDPTKPQLVSNHELMQTVLHLICDAALPDTFSHWGEKYVCFTHGLDLGFEKERLTVHLWAANEGVILKKRVGRRGGVAAREVPRLCKPLQFSLECLSLGLNPHRPPPNRFRLKFLHFARPCAPLLPQRSAHTKGHSKRINTKSMGNSEKSKKEKEREKSP